MQNKIVRKELVLENDLKKTSRMIVFEKAKNQNVAKRGRQVIFRDNFFCMCFRVLSILEWHPIYIFTPDAQLA